MLPADATPLGADSKSNTGAEPDVHVKFGKGELKRRTIWSVIWTLSGMTVRYGVRFGSSLILTRLLFPEVYGLMAIVGVFVSAVRMFSEIGIRGSIIHNPRGDDPVFLNTAWTLQVIRGLVLWIILIALAYPVAMIYNEWSLIWLMPAVGITAAIRGFDSTALFTLIRHVKVGSSVWRTMLSQVVAAVVMIIWALIWPSVWALVAGTIAGAVTMTALSYCVIPGYRNWFQLDRTAAASMFRFGRWVFIATIMTWFAQQGDRLLLGKIVDVKLLGIYTLAVMMANVLINALESLTNSVLFPVYAKLRDRKTRDMRHKTALVRGGLCAGVLPVFWAFAIFGQQIVGFLYDPRYYEAGWMLQVLAVGAVGRLVTVTAEGALLANGDSFRNFIWQTTRAILLVLCMAAGGYIDGIFGLTAGVMISRLVDYLILSALIYRYRVWLPWLDAAAMASSLVVIGFGLKWMYG